MAKTAKLFNIPTILTAVETESFSGYIWPELMDVLQQDPIERTSMNSWEDTAFVEAVKKKLVMAALCEDFLQPRPDMAASMEKELGDVVRFLVEQRWPFRLHATYDETISRVLDVFEETNKDTPFNNLRWFFDHAETVSDKSLARIQELGGGVAIQHYMAFHGEYFVDRYGAEAVIYNPFVSLYWMVTEKLSAIWRSMAIKIR